MASAASGIPAGSLLGGVSFVVGLVVVLLGYTAFGRIAPHPRIFWGMLGIGFMVAGVGLILMEIESGTSLPLPGDIPAILAHKAGFYVLMLGVLFMGLGGAWAYLQQNLYTSKVVVIEGKPEIEHTHTSRLRHRNLMAAAAGLGGSIGVVIASTLLSFSRTAPQGNLVPIAVAVGVGCVVGGIAFGVAFLVLRIWLRHDLIT